MIENYEYERCNIRQALEEFLDDPYSTNISKIEIEFDNGGCKETHRWQANSVYLKKNDGIPCTTKFMKYEVGPRRSEEEKITSKSRQYLLFAGLFAVYLISIYL